MAEIQSFKAVRPTRDKAHLVASRPIASYKPSILAAKLEENPFTFIHIIHPEYFEDEVTKTEPNTVERFEKVKAKYEEFCADGIFMEDSEEALYVYRQTKNNHAFIGVIGGASVDEYKADKIKKHEATLTSREALFTTYLEVVGINAEPVLLTYKKSEAIDELLTNIAKERPEYDFTTTDRVRHELWIVNGERMRALQIAFAEIEALYIADGHHRSSSSVLLSDKLAKEKSDDPAANHRYFLSFIIDESKLKILPYNRLVKDLGEHNKASFLQALQPNFEIIPLENAVPPQQIHDIHCYIGGSWYLLRSKSNIIASFKSAVDGIDAEILTKYVLTPHLGIADLKTDPNIDFINGEKGLAAIEEKVNNGKFDVGFALYPVAMEQVRAVADEGAIMPPKSTWVEPKMRSGLTIYKIHE